jgi:hypothetical protein
LKKCFDNINKLKFKNVMGKIIITKMISSEPESMPEKAVFTEAIEISNDEKV